MFIRERCILMLNKLLLWGLGNCFWEGVEDQMMRDLRNPIPQFGAQAHSKRLQKEYRAHRKTRHAANCCFAVINVERERSIRAQLHWPFYPTVIKPCASQTFPYNMTIIAISCKQNYGRSTIEKRERSCR